MKPYMGLARCVATLTLLWIAPLWPAAAAAGDSYVYRVVNGYNKEVVGHTRLARTADAKPQREVMSVSVDNAALGMARTEIYGPQGQWLRRPLDNHGVPVEYEFLQPLPATQPEGTAGQSWSVRVPARVAGDTRTRSVRIDGTVLGQERIRVPAGEYDTVKIRRIIYPGDADYFITETQILEFDWYAPAVGRSVRTETRSTWRDTRGGCIRHSRCDYRGDWFVYELTDTPAAGKP